MNRLRAVGRMMRGLLHIGAGFWLVFVRFPRLQTTHREAAVQAWAQRMLAVCGIGLTIRGEPPAKGPLLLVANHISWLDILVLHAARHCRFVSKSDVRHWPLIGTLATASGTLYIERASPCPASPRWSAMANPSAPRAATAGPGPTTCTPRSMFCACMGHGPGTLRQ